MGYLFACTRSKTNAFQVNKVQTPGLEQCCCHFGLFLIYAHVLSHVLYDFTITSGNGHAKVRPQKVLVYFHLSVHQYKTTNQPTNLEAAVLQEF